jgi:hypothetical protein
MAPVCESPGAGVGMPTSVRRGGGGCGRVPVVAALAGSAGCLRPRGGATVSVHSRTPRWATAQKPSLRNGSRPLDGTPPGECAETGAI